MLMLHLRECEWIEIDGPARITLAKKKGNKAWVGIEARAAVNIRRVKRPVAADPPGKGPQR